MSSASRHEQIHVIVVDSGMVSSTGSRSSSHYGSRPHPQSVAHQKGLLPNTLLIMPEVNGMTFCPLQCSNQQLSSSDDQVQNSGSGSPSGASSENLSPVKDFCGISNTVDFNEMGLVHNSPSLTASTSQQHQVSAELPNFPAYDQEPV